MALAGPAFGHFWLIWFWLQLHSDHQYMQAPPNVILLSFPCLLTNSI